jgi:hypothetical protein
MASCLVRDLVQQPCAGLLQAIVMSANSSPGDLIDSRDLLVRRNAFSVDGISSR